MKTILLVENDRNQRRLYQMELEEEGYRVIPVSDGREALQQVKEELPDLMVLDLLMPGLDGVETLDWIIELKLDLPVIIYSAYGGVDNAVTQAADAYLIKSSNVDLLKVEVQQVLMKREERKSSKHDLDTGPKSPYLVWHRLREGRSPLSSQTKEERDGQQDCSADQLRRGGPAGGPAPAQALVQSAPGCPGAVA